MPNQKTPPAQSLSKDPSSSSTTREDFIENLEQAIEHGIEQTIERVTGVQLASRWLKRVLRTVFWSALIVYFSFCTAVLILRYVVLPQIDDYRLDIERLVSKAVGLKVAMADVDADWHGLNPRLTLKQIVIFDQRGQPALVLPKIFATLSWESIVFAQVKFNRLEIEQPDLDIRRDAQGKIYVAGILLDTSEQNHPGLSEWLLAQDHIVIRQARLRWNDEQRQAPELVFNHLDLVLQQFANQHRFGLNLTPPPALAAPFTARGYFRTPLFARHFSDPKTWQGQLYVDLAYADLAAWHAYFDYPIEFKRGNGALRAWLSFSDSAPARPRLLDLTADVRLTQVMTRLQTQLPTIGLANISGRLRVREFADGHELSLRDFDLLAADGWNFKAVNLTERYIRAKPHQPAQAELQGNVLDLETLARLSERFPVAAELRTLLATYQPRGVLNNWSVKWQGAIDAPLSYEIKTNFQGLSMLAQAAAPSTPANTAPKTTAPTTTAPTTHPALGRPGFKNLTGTLYATQQQGTLTLASSATTLSFPGIFEQADINFNKLTGQLNWTRQANDLEVRAALINFENQHAAGWLNATYKHGPHSGSDAHGPGWLDLDGRLTHADARYVPRYLPLSVSQDVRRYLQAAILQGTTDDTRFKVHGDLHHFPFATAVASATQNPAQAKSSQFSPSTSQFADKIRQTLLGKTPAPTTPATGEFRVAAKLKNVKFNYLPNYETPKLVIWPLLENVDADLIFDRARMEIQTQQARIANVKLENVKAEIPDLIHADTLLKIAGRTTGGLQDYLGFVNASPVSDWTDRFFNRARASGNAQLDLQLELALAHLDASRVSGILQFNNNDVLLHPESPPIQRLSGRIDFNQNHWSMQGVKAQLLGGPFKIDGGPTSDGLITLRGSGTANAQNLQQLVAHPIARRVAEKIKGSTRYGVLIRLPQSALAQTAKANLPFVVIDSNLVGIAADLPAPFHKANQENLGLKIEVIQRDGANTEVSREHTQEIRIALGTVANALLERKPDKAGVARITRSAYGINQPAILIDQGSYANLNLKVLDLDAWQALLAAPNTAPNTASNTAPNAVKTPPASLTTTHQSSDDNLLPDTMALRAAELIVSGKSFANVIFAASRSTNPTGEMWQANLEADQISGYLAWRPGPGNQQSRLTARLARLVIPQATASNVSSILDSTPKEMPGLDIVAENFELRGKKLGTLELLANNAGSGTRREWRLQKLLLTNSDAKLDAQGVWGPDEQGSRRTALTFNLNVSNLGKLMDRFALKDTLRNGSAVLDGTIAWRGSPLGLDYPSLSGRMTLEAERGQFLKADPGIAKLLGVLSLQALPRRITLDFRDVFSEGFAFDLIRANATIENGLATTRDFKMRGVSATVLIDGAVDLAQETQNLRVLVLPEVSAGAGSLAYALLANPAVGLATFVAQAILKDPLAKALSFEYQISGTWLDPSITKVDTKAHSKVSPTSGNTP